MSSRCQSGAGIRQGTWGSADDGPKNPATKARGSDAIVGDQADAERAALQELGVPAESLAERGQVRQGGLSQPNRLEVAQVVGLGANQ